MSGRQAGILPLDVMYNTDPPPLTVTSDSPSENAVVFQRSLRTAYHLVKTKYHRHIFGRNNCTIKGLMDNSAGQYVTEFWKIDRLGASVKNDFFG